MKTFIISWLIIETLVSKPEVKGDYYEFIARDSTGQQGKLYSDKLFQPGNTINLFLKRKTCID